MIVLAGGTRTCMALFSIVRYFACYCCRTLPVFVSLDLHDTQAILGFFLHPMLLASSRISSSRILPFEASACLGAHLSAFLSFFWTIVDSFLNELRFLAAGLVQCMRLHDILYSSDTLAPRAFRARRNCSPETISFVISIAYRAAVSGHALAPQYLSELCH